jgi:hypothetical protein
MTWQYKSLREICVQLKDVQLNGGRDLAALQEDIAKDDLVAKERSVKIASGNVRTTAIEITRQFLYKHTLLQCNRVLRTGVQSRIVYDPTSY